MIVKNTFHFLLIIVLVSGAVHVKGASTSAGLTLLESPSVRSAGLADAVSSDGEEAASFLWNPAILSHLMTPEISILHEQRFEDQSFSQISWGRSAKNYRQGLGFSSSLYSAGELELFNGTTSRQVHAQQDHTLSLAYAHSFNLLSLGLALKGLRSNIAEQKSSYAVAVDVGAHAVTHQGLRLAVALQNFGSDLKYESRSHALPLLVRLGASYHTSGSMPLTVLFDTPYYFNESEWRPSAGLEMRRSALSFRGGTHLHADGQGLTLGMGFYFGRFRLDYAFGMIDEFDDRHRVGLTMELLGQDK